MTHCNAEAPFTVSADFDLAPRPGLALRAQSADVAIRRSAVPESLPHAQARGPAWEHGDGRMLMHTNAVCHGGVVHGFAGPSGTGKSTLAAALGRHGLAFFTDDLLLLDPASFEGEEGGAKCYGIGGLKLFPHARKLIHVLGADATHRLLQN